MGKLHRIEIENFKSYRGRHVIGPFEQFTCIIGPNGSGKSNLMDAISFVLAIPAKYLRSQNLQELIYNNENDELNASTCNVSLFYITDEVDHENNEKVNPGEEIEFFRRVNANGSSQYKINGKQVTNEDYIRKLASFNILVSCRNFLVYQGDVQNISTRSPEEMALLFEQISGSYDLRSEYETLREKREQLKSVTDMILKKKYTMMSERRVVEDQKKEATEFQKKLDLLRDLRVEYFLWQLFNIESNLEDHARKVKSLKTKAEQLEESDQELRQNKAHKQMEIVSVNETIQQKERNQREIEEKIKEKQPESIKLADKLRRYRSSKEHSEKEEEKLRKEKSGLEEEMNVLNDELTRMTTSLEALMEAIPHTQSGVVLTVEQKETFNQLKQTFMSEAGDLIQSNEIRKVEEATLLSQIKQKTEVIQDFKQEENNTRQLIEELRGQKSRLTATLNDIERVIHALEEESETLQNQYSSSLQLLNEKRKQLEELNQTLQGDLSIQEGQRREKERRVCVQRLQDLFPEVHGLLIDLINPIQKKYSVAVETALGSHLDAVVVSTKAVAIECIQFLKEQHLPPMDFYPLDALRPKELRLDLRHQNCRLCYELLEFDSAVEVAVRYAVGNTVVADNLDVARELAYEKHVGEKIVTLNGEEISKSGAMSGGSRLAKGGKFKEKSIQKKREESEKLEHEITSIDKELQRSARNSEKMRSIESNLLTQRGKKRVFTEEVSVIDQKIAGYGTRMNSLATSIHQTQQEMDELRKQEEEKTTELSLLHQKLKLVEKRVYRTFLREVGVQSVDELENEYFKSLRENERMQNECRTHIALIENKTTYNKQRLISLETSIQEEGENARKAEKSIKGMEKKSKEISVILHEMEENVEAIQREIGVEAKKRKDIEIVVFQIDQRIRENRTNLKKLDDQLSTENSAMETLRSKRNSVLKSAIMEQIQIPFLNSRDSQRSSSMMETEDESAEMEIESETPLSQRFSQSQSIVVQNDQEQVDRIDFSALGNNPVAVNESEYGKRDEEYRDHISKLAMEIDRMQPNMLAEQKYNGITEKVNLINVDQKENMKDYQKANKEFSECAKKRKQLFMDAFNQVESVIDETYKNLTHSMQNSSGGMALLALTNPGEPFLGGVKYAVSPLGKQYRDISQLSGGEKTIATLALLFALHSYRKAPFFIMDEVDNALDNANVERVARYLMENSKTTQCIIISHKELLFERSDSLVGVYHNWKEASSSVLTIDLRKYDVTGDQ